MPSCWAASSSSTRIPEEPPSNERPMEAEEGGGSHGNCHLRDPLRRQAQRTEGQQQPIHSWRASAGAARVPRRAPVLRRLHRGAGDWDAPSRVSRPPRWGACRDRLWVGPAPDASPGGLCDLRTPARGYERNTHTKPAADLAGRRRRRGRARREAGQGPLRPAPDERPRSGRNVEGPAPRSDIVALSTTACASRSRRRAVSSKDSARVAMSFWWRSPSDLLFRCLPRHPSISVISSRVLRESRA